MVTSWDLYSTGNIILKITVFLFKPLKNVFEFQMNFFNSVATLICGVSRRLESFVDVWVFDGGDDDWENDGEKGATGGDGGEWGGGREDLGFGLLGEALMLVGARVATTRFMGFNVFSTAFLASR